MACSYCGNSYHTSAPTCAGCGAPRVGLSREETEGRIEGEVYESIGRALVARQPNEKLKQILGAKDDSAESLRNRRNAQITMVFMGLLMLPVLPWMLVWIFPFFFLFYLPYKSMKKLVEKVHDTVDAAQFTGRRS